MSKKYSVYAILIFTLSIASCSKKNLVAPKTENLVLTPLEQQNVWAGNTFTLKLFRNLDSANTSNVNLFASPLSVSFAVGMTSNGANGQTLTAIRNAMDFNGSTEQQTNSYYQNLIANLPKLDPNTTLNIANSIWYRQGFSVVPQFLQTNSTYYNANVQSLNFNDPTSISTINNWVNKETSGKISTIINQISPTDVMFLINAIYFKSTWAEKFDPTKTSNQPFYLADNSTVQTPFMDSRIDYNRYDDSTVSVFELPYSNSKYSMVIAMPTNGSPVQQLVSGLDSAKWQNWVSHLHPAIDEIKLPKFKFSYNTPLNDALTSFGMGIAFSDAADFSGISSSARLYISSVIHKAYVEVDESGTTAAATTVVVITTTATRIPPVTVINHPFVFAIREIKSGLIVFTGVVNNPLLTGN